MLQKFNMSRVIALILSAICIPSAFADGPALPIDSGDTAWLLVSSALVFFMTPGLGLFYGGLVHRKNVLNTIQMSLVAAGVLTVIWACFGYSLAFAPGNGFIGDGSFAGLKNVGQTAYEPYGSTVPHLAFMVFQMMFAIVTPALISGTVVERMSFRAYFIFIVLWSILVYNFVAHWVWSVWCTNGESDGKCADGGYTTGWLKELGALDYAGGIVVHVISGYSSLVAAKIVGPRRGYPSESSPAHNLPMMITGTAILWFGWFGFNAGSAINAGGLASQAFVNTHISTATSFLLWMFLEAAVSKPSTAGACTGALIGLISITPAAGFVETWASFIIGIVATLISFTAIYIKHKYVGTNDWFGSFITSLDDSLDVFCCHGLAGTSGALLTGLFATKKINPSGFDGAFYGNPRQFGVQLAGVVVAAVWSMVLTAVILTVLKYTVGLRVSEQSEIDGLDVAEHGEIAYHLVSRIDAEAVMKAHAAANQSSEFAKKHDE
jgi:Amt family ammonium transporter